MSSDLIWPSAVNVGDEASHESIVRAFETEEILRQWNEKKERLFCKDEEDMLVECGIISEKGVLTSA